MGTKRLTLDAMFLCAALMLAFLESLLPSSLLPGVRLGLANLATLGCVYAVGLADGAVVGLTRCVLTSILFGGGAAVLFSLSGTLAALAVLALLRLFSTRITPRLSFIGISVWTAAAHNLGQLLCAGFVYGWGWEILFSYGGILLLSGLVCGILTGTAANLVFSRLWPRRNRLHR